MDSYYLLMSARTAWNLSRKMSTCFVWRMRAGRNRRVTVPLPPVCTPTTIEQHNLSATNDLLININVLFVTKNLVFKELHCSLHNTWGQKRQHIQQRT